MSDIMVSVEGVSKKFCRSLKHGMLYTVIDVARDLIGIREQNDHCRPNEFWANRNVTFELKRGECMGLIGLNGAGKSTLLKLLNGIIRPDEGRIRMRGRIGALIEVGAGFHPMLTGRENIYVNGAILGMSIREITRKLDAIIEFSGLESAILDAPVKTYSSGMYVRLGFAVAVHTEPDILLVDEVLAVGDARFTGKCRSKIDELRRQGTCLVFVSHNLSLIEQVCDRGIMLAQGQIRAAGSVNVAIHEYHKCIADRSSCPGSVNPHQQGDNRSLRFLAGEILGNAGDAGPNLQCGDEVTLRLTLATTGPITTGVLSIWLVRKDDQQTLGLGYLEIGRDLPVLNSGELNLRLHCQALPGEYQLGVTFSSDGQFDLIDEFMPCTLCVQSSTKRRVPNMGGYMLNIKWDGKLTGKTDPTVLPPIMPSRMINGILEGDPA
jgi:ABC-type polysaccharide/polyol phosphate transport system ATPase subunit